MVLIVIEFSQKEKETEKTSTYSVGFIYNKLLDYVLFYRFDVILKTCLAIYSIQFFFLIA